MFAPKVPDFNYYLQQLCSFCYKDNKFHLFKDGRCVECDKKNINPVYVNPKKHDELVRDFRNSGNCERGLSIEYCNHVDIIDKYYHSRFCSYAINSFEYFIWNWMKTYRKFKISEIFNEFVAPYVLTLRPRTQNNKIKKLVSPRIYKNAINPVPRSMDENQRIQQDEKKKIYFCWFCFKDVTSERDIALHLNGTDHKAYYEADKKRRWYFKMPKSQPVTICNDVDCYCFAPHIDDEHMEMIARSKFRKFNFRNMNIGEKDISPWPINITISIPKFPNDIECYKKPIRITVKLIVKEWRVSYICMRDDESRPFFNMYHCHNNQKGQILKFEKDFEAFSHTFEFDIEFWPLCSGTYCPRVEFGFFLDQKECYCQKRIRVDVGTSEHLEKFTTLWSKYNTLLKRNLMFENIVPFSCERSNKCSILKEDLLRRIFRVVSNLEWIDTRVEPWNYCDWMADMMVHEELEQQLLLSQLIFIGDVKIADNFNRESFVHTKPGQLFGTIVFKNECHSSFAREFVVKNINKVFVVFQKAKTSPRLYECDLVDLYFYNVESRSINEVTLCFPENAVRDLQLKRDTVFPHMVIHFRYNRMVFERRHKSLEKMPHYDTLSYTPLCCPSFTRLPYGDDQSTVSFNPKLTLNAEQQRLPKLVLRNIKSEEIVLPFILNGAFGTGKSSVIAETVRTIISVVNNKSRVLICTRSYSAGKVYLDMFRNCLDYRHMMRIKVIVPPKKQFDSTYKELHIYNEDFTKDVFDTTMICITSLDNVTNAMEQLAPFFGPDNAMFDYLFVDEAAQVLEVDAIMVYQFGNKRSKFIFAGDVFQVRPEYHNMSLKKFSVPIVCRLHVMYKQCPDYEICLKTVYRAHPALVQYLSDAIYCHCGLTTQITAQYPQLKPMKFIDSNINGDNREEYDHVYCSFRNDQEGEMIVLAIQTLLAKMIPLKFPQENILVCTPFYSQVKLIRDKLKKRKLSPVVVEQPSGIQGKEFDAVFISTVLTVNNEHKHPILHPTFHSNKNLINLAISRAKHYVEVVGDKRCLLQQQCTYQWQKFIEFSM